MVALAVAQEGSRWVERHPEDPRLHRSEVCEARLGGLHCRPGTDQEADDAVPAPDGVAVVPGVPAPDDMAVVPAVPAPDDVAYGVGLEGSHHNQENGSAEVMGSG